MTGRVGRVHLFMLPIGQLLSIPLILTTRPSLLTGTVALLLDLIRRESLVAETRAALVTIRRAEIGAKELNLTPRRKV